MFLITGLFLLCAGMLFGISGSLQYVLPGFLKEILSFEKMRPLHVSSVVFWIIFGAMGSVMAYLQQHTGKRVYSAGLFRAQFYIFLISTLLILISYFYGVFGGREYWEFHPYLAFPIIIGWLLFLYNFIRTIGSFRNKPVYVWMWLTGILFFLFTYIESYLWVIPYFRNNIINDMTIQWKSYGSMVGSWNMLLYGCSIFLMEKISGESTYSYSRLSFSLYFIGLFNLMFNWGHHIYTLPTHAYIQYISYIVSMTELLLLGRIIWNWKSSVSEARKHFHIASYRFLLAAEIWVFLTLTLAILMSIPVINVYTHGTHITVAHTMGATIGINTFLLLAAAFDQLRETCLPSIHFEKKTLGAFVFTNISLFVFWISLIGAGVAKASWHMKKEPVAFQEMMLQLRPYFMTFCISGIALTAGILLMVYPLLKNHLICYFRNMETPEINNEEVNRMFAAE